MGELDNAKTRDYDAHSSIHGLTIQIFFFIITEGYVGEKYCK